MTHAITPKKTEPYRPSNGTEGEIFISYFCCRCERDKSLRDDPEEGIGCHILANSFAYSINDPNYPKEWVRDEDADITMIGGNGARCTAFVEEGKDIPYRCASTGDLFK